MNRLWAIPLLLAAAACAGVPSPSPRPRPIPNQETLEAGGTAPMDAFGPSQERWRTWSLSHGAAKAAGASPFDGRIWQEIGPRNIAGRVLSVAFDPNDPDVLWAGSAGGGLYRSGDFGQSWRQMGGDHLPSLWIGAIAIDPRNPQILYMGTGDPNTNVHVFGGFGGLLKTTDGGLTFQKLPVAESAFFRTLVSAADSNLVLTAAKTGLYRSADAGGHFAKVLTGEITDFAQDPRNPARLVAVRATTSVGHADSGLFESLDAGLTWSSLGTGLPDPATWGRGALAFPPSPSTVMYLALGLSAGASGSQRSGLFRSTDSGKTWTLWATDRQNGYGGMISYGAHLYAPVDEKLLVQANGFSVLVSRDGGLNWTQPGGSWHLDTHGLAFHPKAPERMVLATDGGVAVSTDGGGTFNRADHGFPTVQFYSCAIGLANPTSLFGGTQDNWMSIYRGVPGGTWEFSLPPNVGDVGGVTINPANPQEIVAVTAYAFDLGFSSDEGRTWTATRNHGLPADEFSNWAPRLARSPLHPNQVALGARRLDVSADGGRTWQPIVIRPVDPALTIVDAAYSPADDREIWTLWSDGKVFVSEDAGATWQDRSPPGGSRPGTRIAAGPVKGTAYAVLGGTSGARLFRTRDGGATWDDISHDLPDVALNAVLADPRSAGRLLVATDAGVATSGDDGDTWQDETGALPGAIVFDLCLDPISGRIAAATYGRGMWELKFSQPCVPDATTLCLNNNRFEVKAAWTAPGNGSGVGQARPLTADTGYFWFFSSTNVEAIVKVLDGCGVNQNYWVFAGGLTNVQTEITVRDTRTGISKTYTNPQGTPFQPVQDTGAFMSCP